LIARLSLSITGRNYSNIAGFSEMTQKLIKLLHTKAAAVFQSFLKTIVFAHRQNNAEIGTPCDYIG
jgi:hypothetical protein